MKRLRFSIVVALAPWRDAEILSSIEKLNYPKNKFEIIIKRGINAPNNRNNGVKKSSGEIIIFLDDDGLIEPDFLKKVDEFFIKHPQADIVGGPQLTPKTDKLFARATGYVMSNPFGSGGASTRYKKGRLTLDADSKYISGALMICKKSVFKILDFDRNIYPGDDTYFVESAKKKGLTVAFSPDIFIYHRRRPDMGGYVKQIFTFGYKRASIPIIRNKFTSPVFIVPALFVLYLTFLPLFLFITNLSIIPLVLYFLLDFLVSIYIVIKSGEIQVFLPLLFIFPLGHIVYGSGFILGLVKALHHEN